MVVYLRLLFGADLGAFLMIGERIAKKFCKKGAR